MPNPANIIVIGAVCLLVGIGLLVRGSRLAAWIDEHSVLPPWGGHRNRQLRLKVNLAVLGAFLLIVGAVVVGVGVDAAVT